MEDVTAVWRVLMGLSCSHRVYQMARDGGGPLPNAPVTSPNEPAPTTTATAVDLMDQAGYDEEANATTDNGGGGGARADRAGEIGAYRLGLWLWLVAGAIEAGAAGDAVETLWRLLRIGLDPYADAVRAPLASAMSVLLERCGAVVRAVSSDV